MDLRQLTPNLAVSPQIELSDVALLARSGFKTLVNNRPDEEDGAIDHEVMAKAAADAGMEYHYLPFRPGQITPDLIQGFRPRSRAKARDRLLPVWQPLDRSLGAWAGRQDVRGRGAEHRGRGWL
ncbi:beta-lactamase hydrolase domain-containing protein [Paracoccus aerius]